VLVERNNVSLAHAVVRIQLLGYGLYHFNYRFDLTGRLSNIRFFHGDLFNFKEEFQMALAIHSCGYLTDLILDIALANKAKFVISPCCFGMSLKWIYFALTGRRDVEFYCHFLSTLKALPKFEYYSC
jgi:hypothetical protein